MNFSELAQKRYSTRAFTEQMPDDDLINKIIEAGRIAPTARNTQPVLVRVIKSEIMLAKAKEASPCIYGAPLVFVICYDKSVMCSNPERPGDWYGEMDATIVTTHMMLAAADLGLGSCFVERFDWKAFHDFLELPENIVCCAILPVGYPDPEKGGPCERHFDRKPTQDFCKVV